MIPIPINGWWLGGDRVNYVLSDIRPAASRRGQGARVVYETTMRPHNENPFDLDFYEFAHAFYPTALSFGPRRAP